jgi:ribosomal protein S14
MFPTELLKSHQTRGMKPEAPIRFKRKPSEKLHTKYWHSAITCDKCGQERETVIKLNKARYNLRKAMRNENDKKNNKERI